MRHYQLPGWIRGALYVLITAIFIGTLSLAYHASQDPGDVLSVLIGLAALWVLASIAIIAAVRWRLTVTADSIIYCTFIKTRRVSLKKISGYRIMGKDITIETHDHIEPALKITTGFVGSGQFVSWLSSHYDDLDVMALIREQDEIMESDIFGADASERNQNLLKAQKVASYLNRVAVGLMIWCIILPIPYMLVCSLCIILPLMAIAVYHTFHGRIRLTYSIAGAYPSMIGVFLPGLALTFRALCDYNLVDHIPLLISSCLITIAIFVLVFAYPGKTHKTEPDHNIVLAILLIFGFMYGYGTSTFVNCHFDTSSAQQHTAEVFSKKVVKGKSTSYYLGISPWGEQQLSDEVKVSSNLYNSLEVHDHLNITLRSGLLGARWYIVHR